MGVRWPRRHWLPFVGWGLYAIRCIAIDRSSGRSARDQIVEQGAKRLAQGMYVSIFPEGTRVPPGKVGRYGLGGAQLATRTGTPILPLAHNAGEYWGRYAFKKRAGRVKVVIGPLIQTAGRDAMRPPAGDRLTVVANHAPGRALEAGDHVERGRLARAIGADQARDRPRRHLKADPGQRRHPAEADGEVTGLQRHDVLQRRTPRRAGTMPSGMQNSTTSKSTP